MPLANENHPAEAGTPPPFFGRRAWLWWAILGLIFLVGLGVRLFSLGDPPLDFHPTRQLHSALIARGMYFATRPDLPVWQQEMAVGQWRSEGVIEPQVFERLVAGTYRLIGSPDLRVPRLYAILFWLVAAVFLVLLSRELAGWGGAWIAGLFFLLWPYGVTASRAFQPEPLMIALLVAALWMSRRWQQTGHWGWAVAGGVLAGLSIYIKSVALFFLGPALLVLVLSRGGLRRALRSPQAWLLAGLALLPYTWYLIDGVYLHHYLVGQFSLRFFPEMWLDPAFYLRWISNLGRALPFEMLLVALLGAFLVRRPVDRALLLAMWLGYFVYGMTLPHHISTHDYYHLPLFPVVGLGLAAVGETLFQSIRGPRWLARLAISGVLLAAVVYFGYSDRTLLKRSGALEQAQVWQTISQAIEPGASVVALVPDYGMGLEYYAWITPTAWPTAADIQFRASVGQNFDFAAFFKQQVNSKDYFVITALDELQKQPRLAEILSARYTVFQQGSGFIIFDLRSPRAAHN